MDPREIPISQVFSLRIARKPASLRDSYVTRRLRATYSAVREDRVVHLLAGRRAVLVSTCQHQNERMGTV